MARKVVGYVTLAVVAFIVFTYWPVVRRTAKLLYTTLWDALEYVF